MDEPLSNLDAKMRVATRTDIAKLQADLEVTTDYVRHDQVEAMTMGDRVPVMNFGVLQQVDTPLRLYDKPVNLFVAGFGETVVRNSVRIEAENGQKKALTWAKAQVSDRSGGSVLVQDIGMGCLRTSE